MKKAVPIHLLTIIDDPRWQAVQQHASEYDGKFVYAIKTTGIYCRPVCPSRRPKPEHTQFFDTSAQAEAAGFRPCQRCHPQRQQTIRQQQAEIVTEACTMIRDSETPPDLNRLADKAGFSVSYFHKLFKQITGMTPKNYAQSLRIEKLQHELSISEISVTQAIYNSGFNESSNFYAAKHMPLGMSASSYKKGGINIMLQYAIAPCSLGQVLVAASDKGISAILLGDVSQDLLNDLKRRFPKAEIQQADTGFKTTLNQVLSFIDQPQSEFNLPLDIHGTLFQQKVWQVLRQIPPGQTVSYAELAQLIGKPKAARAVAGACAANPVAIVVPCHRVVRNDGGLSGYRWGIERKRSLLNKEKAGTE